MVRVVARALALSGLRGVCAVALLALPMACAGPARSPASTPARTDELALILYEVSRPCQEPLHTGQAVEASVPDLFVETVLLDVPLSTPNVPAANIVELARLPDARLLGTPQLTGKFDVSSTLNLDQHFGVLEETTLTRVSLVPRRGDAARSVLEVHFDFSLPNADPTRNSALAGTTLFVDAPDDQPQIAAAEHPADPRRKLLAIVKTYPIRSIDDLRSLFQCKMRLHQQAIEQR